MKNLVKMHGGYKLWPVFRLPLTSSHPAKLSLKYDMLTGSVKKVTKLQNWDYLHFGTTHKSELG